MGMRSLIWLSLSVVPVIAQERTVAIEIRMFSGRPAPRAVVTDSLDINVLEASLLQARSNAVSCTWLPSVPSTPDYSGLVISFSASQPASEPTYNIRAGYLKYGGQCYVDSGQHLERLALDIAFRYDDSAVFWSGGPKPMGYLACAIPDNLRPASAPCSTSVRIRGPRLFPGPQSSSAFSQVDAAGRALEGSLPTRRAFRKTNPRFRERAHVRTTSD